MLKKVFYLILALATAYLAYTLYTTYIQDEHVGTVGEVRADGSSTVFLLTEAMAEEFQKNYPNIRVTVGISGTGGGFEKFTNGEIDVNNASRVIKPEEKVNAAAHGVEFIELPIAYDGITLVINKNNDFVDFLTVDELKKIWEPGSRVKYWKDIRAEWPEKKLTLYGPGTDSGTFDYFTEAINGKERASRADYTASEDDNVLIQGIAGDTYALGYLGYAYYDENKDKLKAVPIKFGEQTIGPDKKSIRDGSYNPLSRPVYIYVNLHSSLTPSVNQFVDFYLENVQNLAEEVGFIPLSDINYKETLERYKNALKAIEKKAAGN